MLNMLYDNVINIIVDYEELLYCLDCIIVICLNYNYKCMCILLYIWLR